MKRTIILFMVISLCGCATLKLTYIPPVSDFHSIDFRKYTDAGFLFTPEKFEGPYESVGMVTFKLSPEAIYKATGMKRNPAYGQVQGAPQYIQVEEWVIDTLKIDDAVNGIYKRCLEMGADAIVRFRISPIETDYSILANPVVVPGIEISGFAIKRKEE